MITAKQAGAMLGLSARAAYKLAADGAIRATLPPVAWSSW